MSCEENCMILEGHIIDRSTGNTVSEADVKIFWKNHPYASFVDRSLVGETVTAADGSFSFRFAPEDIELDHGGPAYVVAAAADFTNDEVSNVHYIHAYGDSLERDEVYEFDLELYPKAQLVYRLVNTTPDQRLKTLTIRNEYDGFEGRVQKSPPSNTFSEKVYTFDVPGATTFILKSTMSKDTSSLSRRDTLFIPVNSSQEITVEF